MRHCYYLLLLYFEVHECNCNSLRLQIQLQIIAIHNIYNDTVVSCTFDIIWIKTNQRKKEKEKM